MANEGSYGSAAGTAAGAAIGTAFAPGIGTMLGAGLGGTLGGTIGGMFSKKPKGPDISGELARIGALFEAMRAQARVNINREAATGRSAAANNLAARGTYRSPVAQGSFNALEGERLNALASSDAQLMGQEAQLRSGLLRELLGLDAAAKLQGQQQDAARTGAFTGLASNLALAALLRGNTPAGPSGVVPTGPQIFAPAASVPLMQQPLYAGPQATPIPFAPQSINRWWAK